MYNRIVAIVANLITLSIVMTGLAHAHFLGYSSVDGREIRYTDSTVFDSPRNYAIGQWNAEGRVDIEPDAWNTVNDINWRDARRSDVTWAGLYTYRGGTAQEDYITFNRHYVDGYSTARRNNVALHELGHALGLAHSFSGQVMYSYVSTITTVQSHDRSDYRSLWP